MKSYNNVGLVLVFWFTLVLNTVALPPLHALHFRNTRTKYRRDRGLWPRYVEIPLDHFANDSSTFSNCYYVNDDHYKPGGPVFFLDVGEGAAGPLSSSLGLKDPEMDYVRRFGGLLIIWEHRYYGSSMPKQLAESPREAESPMVAESPSAQMEAYFKYLTIEQALEDVVYFARNFNLPSRSSVDFRPSAVPWIFLGGSYSGSRAAWLRQRNPEIIFASLSSSAPMQLQVDFWQYSVVIERAMIDHGLEVCMQDLHAIATWATTAFEERNVAVVEEFLYNATYSTWGAIYATTENTTTAWRARANLLHIVFVEPFEGFQNDGTNGTIGRVCRNLQSSAYTETDVLMEPPSNSIVESFGIHYSLGIYTRVVAPFLEVSYADFVDGLNQKLASTATLSTYSWEYQVCSEFGAFHNGNMARSTNLIPGFINTEYQIASCVEKFGSNMASGPKIDAINSKYNGWNISPTNTFFVNGEYDPWRAISVASNITSTPGRRMTTIIPANGQAPASGDTFGYIIDEGLHCSDLSTDAIARASIDGATGEPLGDDARLSNTPLVAGAQEAHEIFASALSTWLMDIPSTTGTGVSPLSTSTSNAAVPTGMAIQRGLISVVVIVCLLHQ